MPIAYSVYHMQRREDIYGPDAGIFRPERWEDSKLDHVKWAYLPFNGGPRVCLGSKYESVMLLHQYLSRNAEDFGLMLASYAIIRIVQTFHSIELPSSEPWEEPGEERQHLTLTLSNADGCKLDFPQ